MKNHKTLLSALLLSTALVIGGCGNKDKGADGSDKVAEVVDYAVKSVDNKTLEKMLDVKSRKVQSAEAEDALSKMGLLEPSGSLNWASKSGDNGSYSYKDVSVKSEDGETISIGTLDLTGVHMVDGDATFDRLDAKGVVIDGDDGDAKIERLSLARPNPKLGNGIMKAIGALEDLKDLDDVDIDVDLEDGEMAFGAFLMDGFSAKGDDADLTLASIGWGEDEDSGKAVFRLQDLEVAGQAKGKDTPFKITLDSVSGSGIDMNYFRALGGGNFGKDIIARSQSLGVKGPGFNPYSKTFDTFSMKNFNLNIDTLNVTTEGAAGKAVRKGGVTTVSQSLSPLRISFSDVPADRDLKEMKEGLASLGFDELVFSASQTSILDEDKDTFSVKDAVVNLKDGFNLSYDYEGSGLSSISGIDDGEMSPDEFQAALGNMKLKSMNMALTDYNLVNRIINFAAQEQGTSPALIKMQAKGGLMVLSLGAKNEAQGQALSDIGTALGSFIDDGGTLKIRLNPETPVSVDRFSDMDPESIDPAELGFSIEHSK